MASRRAQSYIQRITAMTNTSEVHMSHDPRKNIMFLRLQTSQRATATEFTMSFPMFPTVAAMLEP